MGSKGGSSSPPEISMPSSQPDNSAMMLPFMEMMMQMMSQSNANVTEAAQLPEPVPLPEIKKAPEVDWAGKYQELNNKVKADYKLDQVRKHGRGDTAHTSPLLADEDPYTESILAGGK